MSSSYTTKSFTTGGGCTTSKRVADNMPPIAADIKAATAKDTVASPNIYIYPNPVKNNLHVQNFLSNPLETGLIRIFDTKGGLLLQQRMLQRNNAVDVSRLGAGIYILKLSDSRGQITKTHKFVKQ